MQPISASETLVNLLVQWEELRQQGKTPTPEELCPDDPTIQALLRERVARRQRMHAVLDLPATAQPDQVAKPLSLPVIDGYEMGELVGRGGMGLVFKAKQKALKRDVAVKIIISGAHAASEERDRFRREAEAVARLSHPGIVQIYEVGEQAGCPYLVLEFVGGGNLAQQLDGTPMPPRKAAQLVLDLARAVQHAHEQGIVHRDLKPANVLLTENGIAKIADFGLAKLLDAEQHQTQTGTVLGSPSYMAPEQAAGQVRVISPRTDVYALGALLYAVLTGRAPFQGASFLETLDLVRHHDPVSPQALQPKVPDDLATICLKCLEKAPNERYPSAAALAGDLDLFLRGEAINARQLSMWGQIGRHLAHRQLDVTWGSWSTFVLCLAPFPFLVHAAVFFFFRDRPDYPPVALGVTLVTVGTIHGLTFAGKRRSLRAVPPDQRRRFVSLLLGLFIGQVVALLTILRMVRPAKPEEWFLIYAVWLTGAGSTFFSFAPNAGFLYLNGSLCFALALLTPVIPFYMPLVVGLIVSFNVATIGMVLRRVAASESSI